MVIDSGDTYLVEVQADWSGECYIMSKIIKEIAVSYHSKIRFARINIDLNEHVTTNYGITELPFLLFFKNGDLVHHLIGLQSRKKLTEHIERYLLS